MTPVTLRRLAGLVDARKNRDLARLEALFAEDRRLQAELGDLTATLARELGEEADMPPGRQGLRYIWVEQRSRAIRRRRAELTAAIRVARAAAVQSLGKHRALEDLVDRAEDAEAQARAARAERESPPPAPSRPTTLGLGD
ncbi:MAG: hypothetical protein U1E40_16840 [Amaricoccus sp.]